MSQSAPTLVELLNDPTTFDAVVVDGVALIEAEVASKRGLRAMALKAGFKTLKAIHPRVLHDVLAKLLPRFAPAVDPHLAVALEQGDITRYFTANSSQVADSLLAVTDDAATKAQNRIILKTYQSLRGTAKGHVEDAMPGLAGLLLKHVK